MVKAENKESQILVERDGRVGRIVLNRPDKLNAFSIAMMKEMAEALDEFECDDSIHVVIFRGKGRAFCTGMDIQEVSKLYNGADAHTDRREIKKMGQWFHRHLWEFSKPTVLELKGYCYAGAAFFLSYCDLVVASNDTLIAASENKSFALEPTMGMWPLTIGMRRAKALIFTGDPIDGTTAAEIGMINKAVPLEELEEYVEWLAQKIAKTDLPLLCLHKQSINMIYDLMGAYPMLKTGLMFDHMAHRDSKFEELLEKVNEEGAAEAFKWVNSLNDGPTIFDGPPNKKKE